MDDSELRLLPACKADVVEGPGGFQARIIRLDERFPEGNERRYPRETWPLRVTKKLAQIDVRVHALELIFLDGSFEVIPPWKRTKKKKQ